MHTQWYRGTSRRDQDQPSPGFRMEVNELAGECSMFLEVFWRRIGREVMSLGQVREVLGRRLGLDLGQHDDFRNMCPTLRAFEK